MSLNDLQGDFGIAYVKAVAHATGLFCQESGRSLDNNGVDITLLSPTQGNVVRAPRLDVQVKTTRDAVEGDPFTYDLAVKNYDELRADDWQTPRILVLVAVPSSQAEWVSANENELLLRRCGYWHSLRGQPATVNTSTVRVSIPRKSLFHVGPLKALMTRLCEGGLP